MQIKVHRGYKITIPEQLRKKLSIIPGQTVIFHIVGNNLIITPQKKDSTGK